MAYRFNGTTDLVEFGNGPISGYTAGALTIAMFLKRTTLTSIDDLVHCKITPSGNRFLWQADTNPALRLLKTSFSSSSIILSGSTTSFYLVAATTAAGSVISRFHVHDGTSWTHADGSGTTSNVTVGATDRLFVGGGAGNFLGGDVVCVGIKKANSNDAAVETLSRTAWSAWVAFGFDWLIGFDSSLESAGILQDQASPGTGDEIAITGTTAVADPAGWSWAAGGAAYAQPVTDTVAVTDTLSTTSVGGSTFVPRVILI